MKHIELSEVGYEDDFNDDLPDWYEPDDLESQRCLNLADTQAFIDLHRNTLLD